MSNKKGSHVGFVISFVMFIIFLVFMYVLLSSRIDFGKEKANSLNYVKAEIVKKVSENLTSASIAIGQQNPQNCVQLVDFFLKTGLGNKFVVKSDPGTILQAGRTGNDLTVMRNSSLFFTAYSSNEFGPPAGTSGSCQPLNEGSNGYILGIDRDSTEIFESKILRLFENYSQNYEALKINMKINPGDEFGFAFTYSNGTAIKTPVKNLTVNVYAGREDVQYIKTDAAREPGFIDTIIW
ncbi:MAG: hypothetical protein AABX79_00560 [Nanoarchaeota archaeon]